MKLNEFIKTMPDCLPVLIDCDWNLYRCRISDLKTDTENRHYIIDSFGFENSDNWQLGIDCGKDPMPEELTGEYLFLCIHDSRGL